MQVKIEDQSTVKKKIYIEVAAEDVTAEFDKAYRELGKSASIKGFRKGKVPRKVLESRFGKDVEVDIVSKLVQNTYLEAVKDNSALANIIGAPSVSDELSEIKQGEPFKFVIDVEIKPELPNIDYKNFELKKNMYKISDEEIDAQLEMIRRSMATKKTVGEERPVKESDFVLFDYQGFVDEKPFDNTPKVENYLMEIGNKEMPKEFSEKLIGVIPPQELRIDVAYDENYNDKAFAGKTVTYKVDLKEIQEKELPPLDDTLAAKLGQFESLEAVKNAIRTNLQSGYDVRVHQELSEQVFTKLLEKVDFEVPDALVESELNSIVAETEMSYKNYNMTLEDVGLTKDEIKKRYRDVAVSQAKRHVLLGKIIEQENLKLTNEDMDELFAGMAKAMNTTVEVVKEMLLKKDDSKYQLEYIKMIELEKKAMKHIIDNSNVIEVAPELESSVTSQSEDTEAEPVSN